MNLVVYIVVRLAKVLCVSFIHKYSIPFYILNINNNMVNLIQYACIISSYIYSIVRNSPLNRQIEEQKLIVIFVVMMLTYPICWHPLLYIYHSPIWNKSAFTTHVDKPNITSDAKHHAYEGESFQLTCIAKIAHDVIYKTVWKYPPSVDPVSLF